jgi:hypothetical protein
MRGHEIRSDGTFNNVMTPTDAAIVSPNRTKPHLLDLPPAAKGRHERRAIGDRVATPDESNVIPFESNHAVAQMSQSAIVEGASSMTITAAMPR